MKFELLSVDTCFEVLDAMQVWILKHGGVEKVVTAILLSRQLSRAIAVFCCDNDSLNDCLVSDMFSNFVHAVAGSHGLERNFDYIFFGVPGVWYIIAEGRSRL